MLVYIVINKNGQMEQCIEQNKMNNKPKPHWLKKNTNK